MVSNREPDPNAEVEPVSACDRISRTSYSQIQKVDHRDFQVLKGKKGIGEVKRDAKQKTKLALNTKRTAEKIKKLHSKPNMSPLSILFTTWHSHIFLMPPTAKEGNQRSCFFNHHINPFRLKGLIKQILQFKDTTQ